MRDSDGHSGDSSFRVIDCVSVDKVGMLRAVITCDCSHGVAGPRANENKLWRWSEVLFSVEGMVRVLSVLLVLRRD